MKPPACEATWHIPANGSVLQEQRQHSQQPWPDFPENFPAATFDASFHPAAVTAKFAAGGQPWLAFSSDYTKAHVQAAQFGDLVAVDVNRSGGRVGTLAAKELKGLEVLEFLVTAEIVRTRWHVESTVCVEKSAAKDGTFTAKVSGEHVYFTNESNHNAFQFRFEIRPDGEMWVITD